MKIDYDVIVIAGAPGSGKSSLADLLSHKLSVPNIDFGRLREFHLDPEWIDQNPEEEQLSFENLLLIVHNYLGHGYKNVIIHDLRDFRIQQIPKEFSSSIIFTLVPADSELEKRIVMRNDGWKDTAKAIEWNASIRARPLLINEHLIDNSTETPWQTTEKILEILW